MLWAVVMLSAVAASMIASGRTDVALARNLRAAAIAAAAADGAIHQAALHLIPCDNQPGCTPWLANGARIDASRPGVAITVCLADEAGKLNPNSANPGLMAALLVVLGVDTERSARLAAAIGDWRTDPGGRSASTAQAARYRDAGLPYAPDGQPFADIGDLGFVLGMTPAILDRLRPNLSIWTDAEPDPAIATPAVRAALLAQLGDISTLAIGSAIPGAASRTIAAAATATVDGAQFTRTAIMRLATNPSRPPLQILTWSAAPRSPC